MWFRKKKNFLSDKIDHNLIPKNVAIIMDGNGRWAKSKNLPTSLGHSKGVEQVEEIIRVARKLDIKYITFYAFSTENWKREKDEINHLFKLLFKFYESKFKKMVNEDIRFNIIGTKENLPKELEELFEKMRIESLHCNSMVVNIAFNYGSRKEIVEAINEGIKNGVKNFDEELLESYLYTKNQPDVDLCIRTSGEQRLSNFLLWQVSYAEMVFPKCYWPDFGEEEFTKCIVEYQNRNRRFGGR